LPEAIIEHYASPACVDIDGLGPAMIETLVAKGWVKALPDLYRLQRAELLTLGKNNAKSVDRLLAAIERSKRAELRRVIHGLVQWRSHFKLEPTFVGHPAMIAASDPFLFPSSIPRPPIPGHREPRRLRKVKGKA
jgi:hypothetical protein